MRIASRHPSRRTPVTKRALDLLLASNALLFSWPLFLAIAILIVLDSGRPVLYKAQRVGKGGRLFTFLKFRTMIVDAHQLLDELAPLNKGGPHMIRIPQDPRVTRVGRWLRRHNLDELPQLFSILKGEMSLVGPRPQAPDEVARYTPYQRRRLEVLPGITGLWQVTDRDSTNFEDWVRLDLEYMDNWSFLLDLKICWRTVGMVLFGSEIQDPKGEEGDSQSRGSDARAH